jgi:transposase InsO family protein
MAEAGDNVAIEPALRAEKPNDEEWAYVRPYAGYEERAALLPDWLHLYNHHRSHTALRGCSPFERVKHLCGNYS